MLTLNYDKLFHHEPQFCCEDDDDSMFFSNVGNTYKTTECHNPNDSTFFSNVGNIYKTTPRQNPKDRKLNTPSPCGISYYTTCPLTF